MKSAILLILFCIAIIQSHCSQKDIEIKNELINGNHLPCEPNLFSFPGYYMLNKNISIFNSARQSNDFVKINKNQLITIFNCKTVEGKKWFQIQKYHRGVIPYYHPMFWVQGKSVELLPLPNKRIAKELRKYLGTYKTKDKMIYIKKDHFYLCCGKFETILEYGTYISLIEKQTGDFEINCIWSNEASMFISDNLKLESLEFRFEKNKLYFNNKVYIKDI